MGIVRRIGAYLGGDFEWLRYFSFATVESVEWQCLLRNRYVLCKQWSDVAEAMGYSVSTVKRLHKKILKNLES